MQRPEQVPGLAEPGQDENLALRKLLVQLPGGGQAVNPRQVNIEDRDLGLGPDRGFHDLIAAVPGSRKRDKAALFTIIRRDAYTGGLSIQALADRHGVGRRVVLQALKSPIPPPRKPLPARKSRLDPFKYAIEGMLLEEHDAPPGSGRP